MPGIWIYLIYVFTGTYKNAFNNGCFTTNSKYIYYFTGRSTTIGGVSLLDGNNKEDELVPGIKLFRICFNFY